MSLPILMPCSSSLKRALTLTRALAALSFLQVLLVTFGLTAMAAQPQTDNTTTIGNIRFTLADGLEIRPAIPDGLVKWPVVADWDQQGRLVVVESGGVGWPIQEHNKQLLHRVVRLEDTDHDGIFDKRIVAADQLPFAEGVLCLGESLLVAAPPNIWKLTDTDGDGHCEHREVWFDGQTVTNCANDLHGPYLGRDGWVYWCKGAFGEQTHDMLNGRTVTDKAAHIYRRRPEGGLIESVISGGMDNPVEFAMTPEGEKFFTSTFLQHPGDGKRDGIAHAIFGGVHGKDHKALENVRRTGPLMPIMTHLGPAAPSGLICLDSRQPIYHQPQSSSHSRTLVSAQFNLQKVVAHSLRQSGATYTTLDTPLLVADRIDFHPTDILEDQDGSLIVIDTGGWYDLCCPTSRVDQKTAEGGIYRLSRSDIARASEPSQANLLNRSPDTLGSVWSEFTVRECCQLLHDRRPWVRRKSLLELTSLPLPAKNEAIVLLTSAVRQSQRDLDSRLADLWTLCALGTDQAMAAIVNQLNAEEPSIVQAACQAIAVNRSPAAKAALLETLDRWAGQPKPARHVVRAATEAIGQNQVVDGIDALFNQAQLVSEDPILRHSIVYSLMQMDAPQEILPYTQSASSVQRDLAFSVLQATENSSILSRDGVLDAFRDGVAAASDVLIEHPEWAADAEEEIRNQIQQHANHTEQLRKLIYSWRDLPEIQSSAIPSLVDHLHSRRPAAIVDCFRGARVPSTWLATLHTELKDHPRAVAQLLKDLDLSGDYCQSLVHQLVESASQTHDVKLKLELLAALPPRTSIPQSNLIRLVVEQLTLNESDRQADASAALSRIQLDADAAQVLTDRLDEISARNLLTVIEAVASQESDPLDSQLLDRLSGLPTARMLSGSQLENVYRHRSAQLRKQAREIVELLMQPPADIQQAVAEKLAQLPPGDPVRGLQVFRNSKSACSACHQMGYIGAKIGPELSRIGSSRTREALLEAILFPSARLEQSFQPVQVLTYDGQMLNGLVLQQRGDMLELLLGADRRITLSAEQIEAQQPSTVSIMPAGMTEILTPQELADLLSLLESAR